MTHTSTRPRMAAIYAPAQYAPAAGMAKATCAATVRLAAGPPAPTSRTFTPEQAAPCRVPCGGSSRRRNEQASTGPSPFRPGAGEFKKPGAAVAAPPLSKANSRLRTPLFSLDLFHILKWTSYV